MPTAYLAAVFSSSDAGPVVLCSSTPFTKRAFGVDDVPRRSEIASYTWWVALWSQYAPSTSETVVPSSVAEAETGFTLVRPVAKPSDEAAAAACDGTSKMLIGVGESWMLSCHRRSLKPS